VATPVAAPVKTEAPKATDSVSDKFMTEMNVLKSRGNDFFKEKKYIKAATAFGDAIKFY